LAFGSKNLQCAPIVDERANSKFRIPNAKLLVLLCAALMALNARTATLAAVHAYQRTLAPVAVQLGIHCRFTPSCSRYAETVIRRDGVLRGGWKSIQRVARCNPFTPPATRDEP
jgi:uncharacterized protein